MLVLNDIIANDIDKNFPNSNNPEKVGFLQKFI